MSRMSMTSRLLDASAVQAAERTSGQAVGDLLDGRGTPRGVVVTSPAGAGKSHLVSAAAGRARDRGLRVAVAAPTNEQAFGLVRSISGLYCSRGAGRTVTFVPASTVSLPDAIRALPGVQ